MQTNVVARRTQFSSCDECRRSRVGCDALSRSNETGDSAASCTRCLNRNQQCTFKWMKEKGAEPKRAPLGRRKLRRQSEISSCGGPKDLSDRQDDRMASSPRDIWDPTKPGQTTVSSPAATDSTTGSISDLLSPLENTWLQVLYCDGFDAVFGSWMGRDGCPFLFAEHSLAGKHVNIAEVCGRLDRWVAENSDDERNNPLRAPVREPRIKDRLIDQSMRSTIAAFSARWLYVTVKGAGSEQHHQNIVLALWRTARRDMLRVINRPSYRSMLSLFLFALTPIPTGISEEEEIDGISGQACVHAALQQIQTLRARQRNLQFSGSKVSPSTVKSKSIVANPDAIGSSDFIAAESIAYWAALTFDTSASLTLNCRPLLSSGLFGFEAELPWRLIRTGAKMFYEMTKTWRADGVIDMTYERANQIIASGSAWKLLAWKLTSVFKEALRDGHNESEVSRAFGFVTGAIQQFDDVFRRPLEACQRRMHFLGQQTKLRWYSLMLHYHLSILMFIDIIEATERYDLLASVTETNADAENAVMNALVFGLQNSFTMTAASPSTQQDAEDAFEASFTVPIISIDPYPHHVVASVQLIRKAIDRDLKQGKITDESHASLRSTLEAALSHLPQSSKSVQAARNRSSEMGTTDAVLSRQDPLAKMHATIARLVRSSVTVLGAGSQGRRLAYMWSSRGNDVHLIDGKPSQRQESVENVNQLRSQLDPNGNFGKVRAHSPDFMRAALSESWLVVECIPERLRLKQEVITQLDDLAPENTIIASNSSSYPCSEIVSGLSLKNAKRVLSAHTYWPPETTGNWRLFLKIWAAIKREALLTAAEGAGTPEEIDAIFRGVLKTEKGPFELMDIVGLDVVFDIEQHYAAARRDIPEQPRSYLASYLEKGHLGAKSGRGFYRYDSSPSMQPASHQEIASTTAA
ncbi:3-hydroxyacyl-CoA dehydrogenase, NAD binding protein, partial [Metarhizium majus ARSEF 297]